ncbi:hypothetical protein GOP47_0030631 [Adiantum capillus-veneris]|nr:hypothetical protein GOP47_0031232 [Adiantum capillus-veneris]KAI5054476.1 hypothetical protein GOP47_0030631 [Adiantum capillus-veneris]
MMRLQVEGEEFCKVVAPSGAWRAELSVKRSAICRESAGLHEVSMGCHRKGKPPVGLHGSGPSGEYMKGKDHQQHGRGDT